jgi:hypothetical protein
VKQNIIITLLAAAFAWIVVAQTQSGYYRPLTLAVANTRAAGGGGAAALTTSKERESRKLNLLCQNQKPESVHRFSEILVSKFNFAPQE